MAQAIEREKQRILEEISQFIALQEIIEKKPYVTPHLNEFKEFLKECKKALEKDISQNIDRIIADYPPAEQSSRLVDFRSMVKRLRELMFNFLLSSSDIPRELYYLSDLFLKYHNVSAKYLICVSDEIATLPFTYILRQLGLDESCPHFWEKAKTHEFYFVQITSRFKERQSAIDWPIILHELAHVVCQEYKMEEKYFSNISVFEALQVIDLFYRKALPPNPPLVELSTKKLYVNEHLADLLVTRCYGATFLWRFLEGHIDLIDVFEPDRTHPFPDKRIDLMFKEIDDELGMSESSSLIKAKLKLLLADIKTQVDERVKELDTDTILKDVNNALTNVRPQVRKRCTHCLTPKRVRDGIRESSWFKILSKGKNRRIMESKVDKRQLSTFLKELSKGLRKGIPIIVDPPILYYLSMLESLAYPKRNSKSKIKISNTKFNELIADSIRLFVVEQLFLE
jgi:hypothetical protein